MTLLEVLKDRTTKLILLGFASGYASCFLHNFLHERLSYEKIDWSEITTITYYHQSPDLLNARRTELSFSRETIYADGFIQIEDGGRKSRSSFPPKTSTKRLPLDLTLTSTESPYYYRLRLDF